jgi:signal transduction histidine kinase/ActR/RegA family two-component response regulator
MDADLARAAEEARHRPEPAASRTPPRPESDAPEDEIDRLTRSFDAMFARATHERQLEEQLQQAQRLEAVGRLAGGVAHDFNNVLTVISNYSELLRADAADGSQAAADLDQVLRATERASRLTRQLLAFSRRQILQPERLDLNAVVRDAHAMLRRLIPTSVSIELDLSESLTPIVADPVQVEQVLVNLAVNAADAMPLGGHLVFRTQHGELDADDATPAGPARRYACLVVRDDGMGMDRATVARIFEPFFTTKEQGKGTGLGLATVHGIVTQLGGRIWVYSEPGKGTTFKVFLPLADEQPPARRRSTPRPAMRALPAGQVMLVEDDDATRDVTARILEERGFGVRTSHDGAAALLALHAGPLPDLVLTDLMMPGVDGAELAHHIRTNWPHLPVIVMSGYADVELATGAIEADVVLEKPFTARALLDAISRALAEREAREA